MVQGTTNEENLEATCMNRYVERIEDIVLSSIPVADKLDLIERIVKLHEKEHTDDKDRDCPIGFSDQGNRS